MRITTFYILNACITAILSMSYMSQIRLIPLLLSLTSLALTTLVAIKIDTQRNLFMPLLSDLAIQLVLLTSDFYVIIPLIFLIMGIFSYISEKYTFFYRILIVSSISSFIFPIAYSVSPYNLVFAPLLVLQVSSLVIMKEAVSSNAITIGKLAYSILFAILIALVFGKWMTLFAIIVIGIFVYKDSKLVVAYENIIKITTLFSLTLFINYVLPIYFIGL